MKAALSIQGRVITGDSHLACLKGLTDAEMDIADSGFYDSDTGQFISESEGRVFGDKEIYLIRHGQTICPNHPDPDIAPEGESQVRCAASCLSEQDIHQFVGLTSPLLRCLRTASILQRLLGITFRIVPELMETPAFLNEGEIFKVKNRAWQFPQFDWPTSKEWHVLPETGTDFYDRVKETLQHIPAHSIVVSHYGYISLTAKIALCKAVLREGFPPASVTYFKGLDGKRLGWTHEEVCENRPAFADRKAG